MELGIWVGFRHNRVEDHPVDDLVNEVIWDEAYRLARRVKKRLRTEGIRFAEWGEDGDNDRSPTPQISFGFSRGKIATSAKKASSA